MRRAQSSLRWVVQKARLGRRLQRWDGGEESSAFTSFLPPKSSPKKSSDQCVSKLPSQFVSEYAARRWRNAWAAAVRSAFQKTDQVSPSRIASARYKHTL